MHEQMSINSNLLSPDHSLGIIYAVVARGTVVLAHNAVIHGNFGEVSQQVLEKIPADVDGRLTYASGDYMYHYVCEDGIIYLCITDDEFERSKAFLFLENIKNRFRELYRDAVHKAGPYAMNSEFSRKLDQDMHSYTETPMSLLNTDQHVRLENIGIRDLELTGGSDIEQLEMMESRSLTESLRSYDSYRDVLVRRRAHCFRCCSRHSRGIVITSALLCLLVIVALSILLGVCFSKGSSCDLG